MEKLKCPRCIDEELIQKIGYAVCANCDFITVTPIEKPEIKPDEGELKDA